MFHNSVRLARIRGIEVRVHSSWLFIAALVTWSFWDNFDSDSRFGGGAAFVMAVAAALLFFGSVLAHELAHSLEARHRGLPVDGITLFLFGGVTKMHEEPSGPGDDFAVTAVGPFTSLSLGAVLGLLATAATNAGVPEAAAVFGLVGWLNVGLGLFNLLPGAPLDGGGIVRAIAWKVTGDRGRATRIAAYAGRGLAFILVGLGLFEVFFVPGAFVGGIWLALIGWFVGAGAAAQLQQDELRRRLSGIRLASLADPVAYPMPPDATVQDAVDRWFRAFHRDALWVADEGGRLVGVLSIDDVRRVPSKLRPRVSVSNVMAPIERLPRVEGDRPASSVLDELADDRVVLVTDHGHPVGMVTLEGLVKQLDRNEQMERVLGAVR